MEAARSSGTCSCHRTIYVIGTRVKAYVERRAHESTRAWYARGLRAVSRHLTTVPLEDLWRIRKRNSPMIRMPTATSGDAGPLRGRVHRPARRRHRRARYPYLRAAAGLRAGTRLRPHRRWSRATRADHRLGDLDEGARQLVGAQPDGLLDQLTGQDLLSVTGS